MRTRIDAYLKNQDEKQTKIDNSVNNQKSEISKSNLSKDWEENRDNMLYREIVSQIILFLILNIIINIGGTRV